MHVTFTAISHLPRQTYRVHQRRNAGYSPHYVIFLKNLPRSFMDYSHVCTTLFTLKLPCHSFVLINIPWTCYISLQHQPLLLSLFATYLVMLTVHSLGVCLYLSELWKEICIKSISRLRNAILETPEVLGEEFVDDFE